MSSLVFAILLGLTTPAARAQTSQASIEGIVVDSAGALVPGATADIRNTATDQHRTLVTDERGAFRFVALPPGEYDVVVDLSGFSPYRREAMALTIGSTVKLSIVLSPAAVSSSVT